MSRSYPKEIKQFIQDNFIGISSKSLAEKINETFGTNYTESQMKSYKGNNKLNSGLTGRYEKGNIPSNKGKKGQCSPGCEKGWFKKGNTPKNHKPIGSERVESKDGYILVKTKEPNKWELKQHVVWREHGRNIPKGHRIIFLDGDKTNFDINNLSLITNEELLIMNRHSLRYQEQELTEVGVLIAKVISQKNKQIRRKKESVM